MRLDNYGQKIYTVDDLCNLYLIDPDRSIKYVLTETPILFDSELEIVNPPKTILYTNPQIPLREFDSIAQSAWFIPAEYKNFDIAKYVLDLCSTDEELQRAGQELIMFQERDMFELLVYLKYLVDTMRKNGVVWGVGRGSSTASYVLFLIGIHKINSLFFDLPIDEFLK